MSADGRGQSADNPYPVRSVAMMVKDWIEKGMALRREHAEAQQLKALEQS